MRLDKKPPYLFITAVILLMFSAVYGLLLRWNFTFPLSSFPYQNVLQSHSHVAFLGWGYLACTGIIYRLFVYEKTNYTNWYKICWLIMTGCIALMLISFPLGGYKVFSIVLLAVFGLVSYVLSYRLLKDLKGPDITKKLLRFGIYYYIISSLATWFLAGVIISVGKTDLYYNTVYFYLHFLYNGFFVFAIFGILFKLFKNAGIEIQNKSANLFFIFLNLACIPTYVLSILWSDVSFIFNIIGGVGSGLQLIALYFLIRIISRIFLQSNWSKTAQFVLMMGITAFVLKVLLQFLSSFPYFVDKSIALKPYYIIGYLHLFTLGFMTTFIILFLEKIHFITFQYFRQKLGLFLFIIGMLSTELLFFTQGTFYMLIQKPIIGYDLMLFIGSVFMVLGLLTLFYRPKTI